MKDWIYQLSKAEAIRAAKYLGLDATGLLDDIRCRLSQYATEHPDMPPPLNESGSSSSPGLNTAITHDHSSASATDDLLHHAKVMNQIRKWGCHFDGRDPLAFLERIEEQQHQY